MTDRCVQDDAFMPAHSVASAEIKARTALCRRGLGRAGFRVRRHKIEEAIIDSRVANVMGLL